VRLEDGAGGAASGGATINMVRLVEVTFAPELRAATSLSRTEDRTSPIDCAAYIRRHDDYEATNQAAK